MLIDTNMRAKVKSLHSITKCTKKVEKKTKIEKDHDPKRIPEKHAHK